MLAGDEQYLPIKSKSEYFADRVYQSIRENEDYKRILVVCGSFHSYEVTARLLENLEESRDFDAYDFLKYRDELRLNFSKNPAEYLEKIALLEVMHEVIDNGCVRELTSKGKHFVDIE